MKRDPKWCAGQAAAWGETLPPSECRPVKCSAMTAGETAPNISTDPESETSDER